MTGNCREGALKALFGMKRHIKDKYLATFYVIYFNTDKLKQK